MTGLTLRRPGNWLNLLDDFNHWIYETEGTDKDYSLPTVDVREEKDHYLLEAEMPGLTEKDVDIKLEGNLLSIKAEKQEKEESKKDGYLIRERRSRSYSRSFVLPDDVDPEKIEASFKNGVLDLRMPKKPESKPKQIPVKNN